MEKEKLVELAFEARENAYVPYSHFRVGACVALKDGKYVKGCNIENAAYGSTMCAERNAVYGAYCQGYKKEDIVALAIVADCEPIASPCGACRQVLSELLDLDIPIYLSNKKVIETHTMRELMPMVFIGESL
ncbi:MAG: cytidine deaminase [Faecalibacillus sp.]